jgi:hypothetical protein
MSLELVQLLVQHVLPLLDLPQLLARQVLGIQCSCSLRCRRQCVLSCCTVCMRHVHCICCWGARGRGSRRGGCGWRRGPSIQLRPQRRSPGFGTHQDRLAHRHNSVLSDRSQVADNKKPGPCVAGLTPSHLVCSSPSSASTACLRCRFASTASALHAHDSVRPATGSHTARGIQNDDDDVLRHAPVQLLLYSYAWPYYQPIQTVCKQGNTMSLKHSSRAIIHHMLLRSSSDEILPPWMDESPRVAYSAACASMWKRRLAVVLNDSNLPMRTRRAFCRAPLPVNRPCSRAPGHQR